MITFTHTQTQSNGEIFVLEEMGMETFSAEENDIQNNIHS